jgi:3-oxoacyl-[acyl-carrier protein] reductase
MLAECGAKVVINDLDRDIADKAAADINGETAVFVGDLTHRDAPDRLIAFAIDTWGQLDIVVNNAGYTMDAVIHKMSDDAFQAMLDIHTIVPFRVLRAAAPHLREPAKAERLSGREVFRKVVNITSLAGTAGNPGQANYSAAKAGVVGLTKTLAKEWGQFKINVNAIAFGLIETRLSSQKGEDTMIQVGERTVQIGIPEQIRSNLSAVVPLGRAGTPAEAAGAVAFLCSRWSDYVTGQVLNVSGGAMIGMDC